MWTTLYCQSGHFGCDQCPQHCRRQRLCGTSRMPCCHCRIFASSHHAAASLPPEGRGTVILGSDWQLCALQHSIRFSEILIIQNCLHFLQFLYNKILIGIYFLSNQLSFSILFSQLIIRHSGVWYCRLNHYALELLDDIYYFRPNQLRSSLKETGLLQQTTNLPNCTLHGFRSVTMPLHARRNRSIACGTASIDSRPSLKVASYFKIR